MGKHTVRPPKHHRSPSGGKRRARQQGAGAPARADVVICDKCRQSFKIRPLERQLEDGGEEHYFACPRCGAEYVMARISARGVELRARMAELRKRLEAAAGEERKALLRQVAQIRWELEPEVVGAKG
jgi:transcription elongation factor Elf1